MLQPPASGAPSVRFAPGLGTVLANHEAGKLSTRNSAPVMPLNEGPPRLAKMYIVPCEPAGWFVAHVAPAGSQNTPIDCAEAEAASAKVRTSATRKRIFMM